MMLPHTVRIVEVGPRDGLQNEAGGGADRGEDGADRAPRRRRPAGDRGHRLRLAEVGAADGRQRRGDGRHRRKPGVAYPVLVPNMKGFEAALAAGAEEIAVFGAASEAFSQKNINCSIAESLERFAPVCAGREAATASACAATSPASLGCPYQGEVAPAAVARGRRALLDMGCYEISLGDTIGVGTPGKAQAMIEAVAQARADGKARRALPRHLRPGARQILAAMELGVAIIDSSVAGLGGCPYAKGASGNVATEDVVYMLDGLGIETGVDLDKLVEAGQFICAALGRAPASKVARALAGKRKRKEAAAPA